MSVLAIYHIDFNFGSTAKGEESVPGFKDSHSMVNSMDPSSVLSTTRNSNSQKSRRRHSVDGGAETEEKFYSSRIVSTLEIEKT